MDARKYHCRSAALGVAALALMLGFAAVALAAGSGVRLTGPTSNKLGVSFTEVFRGYAGAPADRVVAGEQTSTLVLCARTYAVERARSDYFPDYGQTVRKNHHYTGSVTFTAAVPGRHALCVYVIDAVTNKTYAHGERIWVNHS